VRGETVPAKFLTAASFTAWTVLIGLPILSFLVQVLSSTTESEASGEIFASAMRSFGLAALIAAVAVIVGWVPGRLFGTSRAGGDVLLLLLLMPLVLPRYVIYYAWALLLSPTTALGAYLSARPELAKLVGALSSSMVLVLWCWPLAALLIAQGWRNIEKEMWDSASLDADNFGIFRNIVLPLLIRPVLLAFAVCFALSLSEFATFHLAGVRTMGTELAVLYELTGSASQVVRASWPVVVAALIVAIALGKGSQSWSARTSAVEQVRLESHLWRWIFFFVLIGISLVAPIALFVGNISDTQPLRQFFILHSDDLVWSLTVSVAAALMAYLIAYGTLSLQREYGNKASKLYRCVYLILCTSIFVIMFVPASIVAVSMLKMLAAGNVPMSLRQSWFVVSAGQAARFAGVALVMLMATRYAHARCLSEMASLDGASRFNAWWYVHLPHAWPVFVGTFILLVMFGITELSATMILLPAGLPNFAQRLLNQMHYARDQQVIASCLVLVGVFLVMAAALVLLLRIARLRWLITDHKSIGAQGHKTYALMLLCLLLVTVAGCDGRPNSSDGPQVVDTFGRTGRGQGEFVYPRAIDITDDGCLFIVDKTGRIQRLTSEGDFLGCFQMPLIETGKPTGLSVGPTGNLYVADTHYHRVVVFSPQGEMLHAFGSFGQDNGCFIYPTDVAFSQDGRVFVGEYGGNDRISVFDEQGEFLYCFGAPGSGPGQLARPAALRVDKVRDLLYVADACNHRIAIYKLDGTLLGYIGSAGREAGQLRYPYDLALLPDGTLVVCEFGNNRLQLFDSQGRSLAVYGGPGRQLGRLAYPWGVAVDSGRRAFVVDAGNNRIQVWQL